MELAKILSLISCITMLALGHPPSTRRGTRRRLLSPPERMQLVTDILSRKEPPIVKRMILNSNFRRNFIDLERRRNYDITRKNYELKSLAEKDFTTRIPKSQSREVSIPRVVNKKKAQRFIDAPSSILSDVDQQGNEDSTLSLRRSDNTHLSRSDNTHLSRSDNTHMSRSDNTHLSRSDNTHMSTDTPVSLYDEYNQLQYAAAYQSDLAANHALQHRDKRKIFKLRNVALPLTIFHYMGFMPMRIPGMPYHVDPGLPDYNPYKPYNTLDYQEPPLRNRSKYDRRKR